MTAEQTILALATGLSLDFSRSVLDVRKIRASSQSWGVLCVSYLAALLKTTVINRVAEYNMQIFTRSAFLFLCYRSKYEYFTFFILLFSTFVTGQTTNISPTINSFLSLVSTQEIRKTIFAIFQGTYAVYVDQAYPENEALRNN